MPDFTVTLTVDAQMDEGYFNDPEGDGPRGDVQAAKELLAGEILDIYRAGLEQFGASDFSHDPHVIVEKVG